MHSTHPWPALCCKSAVLGHFAISHEQSPDFRLRALQFGVLGRDCAEVAGDRMVATMGTGRKLAVSARECGICGGELQVSCKL